mmetsp:Transcript_22840/g.58080  ORF Transcript_22840/g.58080 Transcript_22840/m.58080 type:complete len:253 (-) Transcript_22840:1734-2492(-)
MGFWPWSELATLKTCLTGPAPLGPIVVEVGGVIFSCMYLGTATWKLRPSICAPVEFVNTASIFVTDALPGSLLTVNMHVNPSLLHAWNGGNAPGGAAGAPKPIAGPPIIAAIASIPAGAAGGGAAGAGEPPSSPRRSSIPPPPMAPGGGAAGVAGAAGAGEPPIRSASRSISGALAGAVGAATAADGVGISPMDAEGDAPEPPEPSSCAAGLRSFFVKAGMCSSTSPAIDSSFRRDVYSTERCCSSRFIEVE